GDNPATRDLVRALYPGLYRLGPNGTREPWLLASEPAGADVGGTPFSVRLRLREEAVWSDGRPITASDLRFTWRVATSSPGIASRDGYDRLTDVVVEAPKVARLVFREPFARWRDLFSAGLGVLPAHVLGKTDISAVLARSWPVSGGPFVLRSRTAGLELVLERNPRAWGEAPLLDRIRIVFVPDPVTALQLYARGEVDVLGPYPAVELGRRAAAVRQGSVVTGDRGATWLGLFLNTRTTELTDARVRRALGLALDRESIVEGLVREQGALRDAPSAGDEARTSPSFSSFRENVGEAERLLVAAGWRGSDVRSKGGRALSVTLASAGADELTGRIARALNTQALGVGIDLNLVSLDYDRLVGDWAPGERFEAGLLIYRDPPGGALRARFGLAGPANVSRVRDQALGRALDAADRALDDASPVVDAPSGRIASLVPVIPICLLEVTLVARAGVREVEANASADGFLWNAGAWWIEGGSSPSPTAS
ncbi:MAG: ABC transporter substrate-binding protein, partial [Actinomycetota bacterium]